MNRRIITEMNRKVRVTLEALESVSIKYLETKDLIQDNIKELCKREPVDYMHISYS